MKPKQDDVPGLLFFGLRNEEEIGLIELVALERKKLKRKGYYGREWKRRSCKDSYA